MEGGGLSRDPLVGMEKEGLQDRQGWRGREGEAGSGL